MSVASGSGHFSWEVGNYADSTSLHHCLQKHRQYFTILSGIQALDTKRPVVSLVKGDLLGICHLLSIQQVLYFSSFMRVWSVICKY